MRNEWESIKGLLPEGWEAAAKETKALQRSRNIQTADDLLTLALTYLLEAGSYQTTSILLGVSGIRLNKNAVRKRIQGSWPWLQWMAMRMCSGEGYMMPRPSWLGDREVLLADATDMALPGSQGSDYRLHFLFNLFAFRAETWELTTTKEGEKLTRFFPKSGAIYIADRVYGTVNGMEHLRQAECGFILRLRSKAFKLYDERGKEISLSDDLAPMAREESLSLPCFYQNAQGERIPIRVVALRKDEEAEAVADRKLRRKASRKQTGPVNPQTRAMHGYILLATNLDDSQAHILELYRARWQIELVFRRMKSLFSFGDVPGHNPDSVKAWFYGKLLIAALAEAVVNRGGFSPEGPKASADATLGGVEDSQPLA